jgi:hypothetical protein
MMPLGIRMPKKISAKEREKQVEQNNMNAVTVNTSGPNWNIPYGSEPNRGKSIFQLTNPAIIKSRPTVSKSKSRKTRKNRKMSRKSKDIL